MLALRTEIFTEMETAGPRGVAWGWSPEGRRRCQRISAGMQTPGI